MRKISSIFVALCIAASAFAQAEMTPQSMLPKRQSVFRTPTTNALDQRVMERLNAEKEKTEILNAPALVQEEGDTIHINAYIRHILHSEDDRYRWGVQSADGRYEFDLAWISETLTGTFTKEDMVKAKRGYANYVKIWEEDNSKNNTYEFDSIMLEVKYVYLTGAIKQLNVDAFIKGYDSKNDVVKYFIIHADREDFAPKDTIALDVPNADVYEILMEDSAFVMQGKTADGTKVSVSLLTTTFPGEKYYFAYFNRPKTFVEFYENGDTIRYEAIRDDQDFAVNEDLANAVQTGKKFDLEAQFLAADSVLYQVKMHYELPTPTDTVVIDINNMLIDDSNAADGGGGYYIDGYNDEYAVELLTVKASGTVESPNMNASIKNLVDANKQSLIELWGKVTFTKVNDSTHVNAEVIANDHVLYQIHMCSRVDAIQDTIVVNMPGHCVVITDQSEGWQFYQETEDLVVATGFYAPTIHKDGDFSARAYDIIQEATLLHVRKAGGEMIQERLADVECAVRPNKTQDTIHFTTWMTTYVGKMYEIHMNYYIPQAKDTVDVTINNCVFADGRNTNNSWSLYGMSKIDETNKKYFVMLTPRGDTLAGRWVMDGMFYKFDFDHNFQQFVIIEEKGEQTIQTSEDFVDGWLECHIANDTIFAEGEMLATNDICYRLHLAVDLRHRLQYDCDDKNQNLEYTYTEEDKCYVSDVAHESNNMLYWVGNSLHQGVKEALLTQIVFFSDEKDPQITIPAGIYPINWSQESGTVLASVGVTTDGANPSLAAFFDSTMVKNGVVKDLIQPLYFFFTGEVEVKKLDDGKKLSIEVNALNSYDVPIHIYYEGVPVTESVTAIEHVENNTTTPTTKYIKDGVLYIRRGERVYNVLGGVVCQ